MRNLHKYIHYFVINLISKKNFSYFVRVLHLYLVAILEELAVYTLVSTILLHCLHHDSGDGLSDYNKET